MSKELDILNNQDQSKNNNNKNYSSSDGSTYEKLPIQYSENQTLSSDKNYDF